MGIVLIVNPHAGGGRGRRVLDASRSLFERSGRPVVIHVCRDGTEPTAAARRSVDDGAELVVAVGGDGHAAAVATGLIGSATPLAVLPAGSANDYARALGMPTRDPAAAVAAILAGRIERVDVVRADTAAGTRYFLNVGGTGFDAAVVRRAERIRVLRGVGRYTIAVLRELATFRAADVTITLDGVERTTGAMMIAVANGSAYGGGMRVAPGARLDSGVLELCVVGRVSKAGFVRAFPLVFRGRHVGHPAVTMLRGREVTIVGARGFAVTGDGELIGTLPATFRVLPRCLSVVVGTDAPLS
jgi:diacylglycerol kinase (ATP)